MRAGEGDLAYPVPWAKTPETSFVGTPDAYRAAAEAAGLHRRRRAEPARLRPRLLRADARPHGESGPPPLGIHLFMGEDMRQTMIGNMIANIEAGLIAPVEMVCRVPVAA